MLTYTFEDKGKKTYYQYLYEKIRDDILSGKLLAGARLPSKRSLAKHLGLSVMTIESAYAQLLVEGYLFSVEKKGYYVSDISKQGQFLLKEPDQMKLRCRDRAENAEGENIRKARAEERKAGTEKSGEPRRTEQEEKTSEEFFMDFSSNQVSREHFPMSAWSRLVRRVLTEQGEKVLQPGHHQGLWELRQEIALHLYRFRGMEVRSEQIVIGAGTEYLYHLLIQLLGRKMVYGIENPGYQKLARIYEMNDVQFRYLDLDREGLSVEALRRSGVQVVHTSPTHHFPTGIVMPVKRRRELLEWAYQGNRYIIEDDYDCEFRFTGLPIPTLQSTDDQGRVIYLNTFSKSLTPSIRISYMVLPLTLLADYEEKLGFYACTVSNFEQYTLASFLREGYFEKHINRMRNYYRNKRNQVVLAIKRSSLAEKTTILEEDAGLHFLLRIHTKLSDDVLKKRLREQGIRIRCLADYSYYENPFYAHMFVVNYTAVAQERLPEAMERILKCMGKE